MQIEKILEWELHDADAREIADLLIRAFGPDFEGRSFHQQRHHFRLVARDGPIIGHMALCYRAVRMGDALVDIIGLAEVATDPDRRGSGIATTLLHTAIAEARASAAQFFVLFGDKGLYGGNGFHTAPNTVIATQMYGARTGEIKRERDESLMVMPLTDLAWDESAVIDLMGFKF